MRIHYNEANIKHGATVVNENVENLNSMWKTIHETVIIVENGCSTHQFNALANDLVPSQIVRRDVELAKLFRNCHQPRAWFEEENLLSVKCCSLELFGWSFGIFR